MSRGSGRECELEGRRLPEVSTKSRLEKKVLKSGRREGCCVEGLGMLCSTG